MIAHPRVSSQLYRVYKAISNIERVDIFSVFVTQFCPTTMVQIIVNNVICAVFPRLLFHT